MANYNNKSRNYKNRQQQQQKSQYAELFAKLSKNGVLVDGKLNSNLKRKITQYTTENVEAYLANPTRYEKELRGVSKYLMQTELHYWRTVMYMTNLAKIVPIVIPNIIGVDEQKIKENYFNAIKHIEHMNLKHELGKVVNTIFIEDVFYGILCDSGNSFYIKRLDPDYCRISSVTDGVYNFEFDLSYFSKDNTGNLFKGYCRIYPEFKYLKKQYDDNRSEDTRWVEIKPSKSICIKLQENLDYAIPPFVASFNDLYDIADYKKMNKNSNEVGNYKLIALEIPLNSKSGKVDDFLVDASTARMFYNMVEENMPEGVGAFLTPMTPKPIEFDAASMDKDVVSNAIKNFYDTTGFSNILFSGANTTGGLEYSTKTDEMILTGSGGVYRQLERWINRYFKLMFNGDVTVQLLDVTSFNIKDKLEEYLKLAQFGVPCRTQIAALAGEMQTEMSALNYIENDVLELTTKWIPLSSSHTVSGQVGRSSQTDVEQTPTTKDQNIENGDNDVNQGV